MSELRWHPLLSQWVITATHRQGRTFLPPESFCPLCPTKPGGFPTEIPAEDFDIVVFENQFPSFQKEPPSPKVSGDTLTPVRPAQGVCEVVVYSPDHRASLPEMPVDRIAHLARVWKDRTAVLGARREIQYVFVFENRGEAVGVTLHHPHGQIYGFPFVPPIPQKEMEALRSHREQHQRCLFCDLLERENADGRRIVLDGDRFQAYVPFFARYPYEVYLAPKQHHASMLEWSDADMEDLAAVLKGLLLKYDALFDRPFPYMMVCHQAPTDGQDHTDFHLHFEFYPPMRTSTKMKFTAGCESGAGNFVMDKLAEESASELRSVGPATVAEVRRRDARRANGDGRGTAGRSGL